LFRNLLLLLLLPIPLHAQQVWLSAGVSSQAGYGEERFSGVVDLALLQSVGPVQLSSTTSYDSARKLPQKRGHYWRQSLGGRVPLKGPLHLHLNLHYSHQDAFLWSKQALSVKLGPVVRFEKVQFSLSIPVKTWDDPPHGKRLSWAMVVPLAARWTLALHQGACTFKQPDRFYGFWSELSLGVRLK